MSLPPLPRLQPGHVCLRPTRAATGLPPLFLLNCVLVSGWPPSCPPHACPAPLAQPRGLLRAPAACTANPSQRPGFLLSLPGAVISDFNALQAAVQVRVGDGRQPAVGAWLLTGAELPTSAQGRLLLACACYPPHSACAGQLSAGGTTCVARCQESAVCAAAGPCTLLRTCPPAATHAGTPALAPAPGLQPLIANRVALLALLTLPANVTSLTVRDRRRAGRPCSCLRTQL